MADPDMDDREIRLRRQVDVSRHDPSNGEAAMAWAVGEIDRLRNLLVTAWRAGAFMFDGPGADALDEELTGWSKQIDEAARGAR